MKPVPLNSNAIPDLELLKEAVCDSLVNLTFQRVSGFGETGVMVFGRKPSRHFVSGSLLPGFDPTGVEDETSDIRINTHGLDFAVSLDEASMFEVSGAIAVYVRGLPEWNEVHDPRYQIAPVFQPTMEIRRALKTAVKDRLAAWRTGRGKTGSYQDYLDAKQAAYAEECRKFGLPGPSADLDNLALQVSDDEPEGPESERAEIDSDDDAPPPKDALYATPIDGIPDRLAEPIRPPEVWVRIQVPLGPWPLDLSKDMNPQEDLCSNQIESAINKAVEDWLKSDEGQRRAYRDLKIVPSDCAGQTEWEAYLARARKQPARLTDLLPNPFKLRLKLDASQDRRRTGVKLVRVALEHHGSRPANARQPFYEPACFQTVLEVRAPTKCLQPLPLDRVKPSYRFRRYMSQLAIGVNCGVLALARETETVLRTSWAPRYVLPRQIPRAGSTAPRDYVSLSDPAFALEEMRRLPEEYRAWIDTLEDRIDPEADTSNEADALAERAKFESDIEAYRSESNDILRGVDLLQRAQAAYRKDPECLAGAPYKAWLLMNETFREAGKDSQGRIKFEQWRLFQLAFILAQIPGFASRLPDYASEFDPARDEETASLLYFATGGGKSEAFFGAVIYLLFLDRLRGKRFGVSALIRYPLRLLTVQQARRLFRLLVHADLIRRTHKVDGVPFQLGFWVGSSNTPNILTDDRVTAVPFSDTPPPKRRSKEDLKYQTVRRALNKVPTCPFCHEHTELRRIRSEGLNNRNRLALMCLNEACKWNQETRTDTFEPLPFLLVDEDIYARAPSIVLGTIDKLALIGQNDNTISKVFGMFGLARLKLDGLDRVAPPRDAKENSAPPGHTTLHPFYKDGEKLFLDPIPGLVIQDEAHLLEESLGAFAGLFETTLEQVFRQNDDLYGDAVARHPDKDGQPGAPRMPKIVAATATVSDPGRQTEILYQRQCKQFPWPGPDLYESFYSQPKAPDDENRNARLVDTGSTETYSPWGRVYVSFMTNGGTHTITTVNILAALHAMMTGLLTELWAATDPDRQKQAVDRLIRGLTRQEVDPISDRRALALQAALDAGDYDLLASLVDLHRVVLTYVTNKKGRGCSARCAPGCRPRPSPL